MLNVRVKRGADVGSDHQLVIANVRLKLRRTQNRPHIQQGYNIQKLQDPHTRQTFITQVKNRFQALQNLNTENNMSENININAYYENVKSAYQQSAEKCLGFREKKKTKEWITADTWGVIDERRKIKNQMNGTRSARLHEKYKCQYKEANKSVKRMVRKRSRKCSS